MIKILIADDHSIVRAGLIKLLEKESDMQVTAEAENGNQVLEFIRKNDYGVIILDINMPGKSGLDVLKEVKKSNPDIKVLILSIYPEENYAMHSFELGASGYLTKDSTPAELTKAIRKINAGGKYVSEVLAEKLAFDIDIKHHKNLHENLSEREMEILLLIAEGNPPAMIAKQLNISVNTIATYRARILEKMKMESNAALIHYAVKSGLVV